MGVKPGRIEDEVDPFEAHHLWRHHHPALLGSGRGGHLEGDLDLLGAFRRDQMEGVDIDRIAHPFHPPTARGRHETGHELQGARLAMPSWRPFGQVERQGLRALHRDGFAHPKQTVIQICRIDEKAEGSRIVYIAHGSGSGVEGVFRPLLVRPDLG